MTTCAKNSRSNAFFLRSSHIFMKVVFPWRVPSLNRKRRPTCNVLWWAVPDAATHCRRFQFHQSLQDAVSVYFGCNIFYKCHFRVQHFSLEQKLFTCSVDYMHWCCTQKVNGNHITIKHDSWAWIIPLTDHLAAFKKQYCHLVVDNVNVKRQFYWTSINIQKYNTTF